MTSLTGTNQTEAEESLFLNSLKSVVDFVDVTGIHTRRQDWEIRAA